MTRIAYLGKNTNCKNALYAVIYKMYNGKKTDQVLSIHSGTSKTF